MSSSADHYTATLVLFLGERGESIDMGDLLCCFCSPPYVANLGINQGSLFSIRSDAYNFTGSRVSLTEGGREFYESLGFWGGEIELTDREGLKHRILKHITLNGGAARLSEVYQFVPYRGIRGAIKELVEGNILSVYTDEFDGVVYRLKEDV